mmetsp:Transcript_121908/g.389869  ORF Transcript_121908/g.389869 Transcript_121908/m.389869 type:complete len:91 (+) Transcript_121908:319-591(+)
MIICYLREDQSEFLEERRLKEWVKKYSGLIGSPIVLNVEKSKEEKTVTSPLALCVEKPMEEKDIDSNSEAKPLPGAIAITTSTMASLGLQ